MSSGQQSSTQQIPGQNDAGPASVLVLASASPARLATLRSAGIDPVVIVSGVDESQLGDLPPAELALQLAELKCATVAARDDVPEGALVLGCDSVLELDGRAWGKPHDAEEAVRRWQLMRGRSGVLHTGHSLREAGEGGRVVAATASTTVHFAEVDDDEIAAYVATGEPLHVAGAFTVDGLGGAFVRAIEGDHHNVVGVSLPLLRELTGELGRAWPALWRR
ncbi:nucleoside triphosphate pyrophosphatase [Nocardioides sp.]|uniref:Maf family protein n=1 Tax=Nocardioides sp. TaxID=35761 RepID=UPI00356421B8